MLMPSIFSNNLFDDFFEDFNRPARTYSYPQHTGIMKTDIRESENAYELDIELPGYRKEDVRAELDNGYLTISAASEKNNDQKDENGRYIRKERFYGSCKRSFYVGTEVKKEDISARFEDGILKLNVPKKQAVPEVPEDKFIQITG